MIGIFRGARRNSGRRSNTRRQGLYHRAYTPSPWRSTAASTPNRSGPVGPADPIGCPFCGTAGAVRDFLSLEDPSRPARVVVRVVLR